MTIIPVARDLQSRRGIFSTYSLYRVRMQVERSMVKPLWHVLSYAKTARHHAAPSWLVCPVGSDVINHMLLDGRLDR
jgi:hypothetical protein